VSDRYDERGAWKSGSLKDSPVSRLTARRHSAGKVFLGSINRKKDGKDLRAFSLVDITLPRARQAVARDSFRFTRNKEKLRQAAHRDSQQRQNGRCRPPCR